jgi:hypothetical protein
MGSMERLAKAAMWVRSFPTGRVDRLSFLGNCLHVSDRTAMDCVGETVLVSSCELVPVIYPMLDVPFNLLGRDDEVAIRKYLVP